MMKLRLLLLLVLFGIVQAKEVNFSSEFILEINSGVKTDNEFWSKHGVGYAELAYLVLRGEKGSVEAIAHIIVDNWKNRRLHDDHMEIQYLAKVLSLNEMSGFLLNSENPELCLEIKEYYIEFKEDFVGVDNLPWTATWCE